jgi:hypothetical protein
MLGVKLLPSVPKYPEKIPKKEVYASRYVEALHTHKPNTPAPALLVEFTGHGF